MNFRTTILLLVLLVAAAAVALFMRDAGTGPAGPAAPDARRLIPLAEADVARIDLANAGGRMSLVRNGERWRMTAPVDAPADTAAVQALINAALAMRTQGQVSMGEGVATELGLDAPAATLTLAPRTGDPVTLAVGNRTGTGGNAYVRLAGRPNADLVTAALLDDLEKPATHFRDARLLPDWRSPEVTAVTLVNVDGAALELLRGPSADEASDGAWRVKRPFDAPADAAAASDVLFALSGLRAEAFVADDGRDAARFGLDAPTLVVTVHTRPAATQPATAPTEPPVIVRVGRFDDVLQRNVFVQVGENGPVAKVPAASIEALRRPAPEFRSREIVSIEPGSVRRIALQFESPAATRPTRPPVVIERSTASLGEGAALSTTRPATLPAEHPWLVRDGPDAGSEADPEAVAALLRAFAPLRANRYLESLPVVASGAAVNVSIETVSGPPISIRLIAPADDSFSVQGSYNTDGFSLAFETARQAYDAANATFARSAPATAPATQPAP